MRAKTILHKEIQQKIDFTLQPLQFLQVTKTMTYFAILRQCIQGHQAAIIKIHSHPINCSKQTIEEDITKTTLAPLSWLSIRKT